MKRYLFSLLLIAAAGGCNRNTTPSETALDNRGDGDESQLYGSNDSAAGNENTAVGDEPADAMTAPAHRSHDELATSGAVPDTTRSGNRTSAAASGGTDPDSSMSAGTATSPGVSGGTDNTGRTNATADANSASTNNNAGMARDNTGVNKRDRNDATLTPMDQGESDSDIKITQEIRRAVVGSDALSFSSKNVKIITRNGKVTLRGTVPNARERSLIEDAAKGRTGVSSVDNKLEISK